MLARYLTPAAFALATGLTTLSGGARAETHATCAGFIDSVPAALTTQGVWCLRRDLSTAITQGAAITVAANNVTIDCNQFKLGGLAAGPDSLATGIHAGDRQNATIRNCSVRGFLKGIELDGGGGHLVEDNRLDNNLHLGILVRADSALVRRNRVLDTGGTAAAVELDGAIGRAQFGSVTAGIVVSDADVLDNVVDGMISARGGTYTMLHGILGHSQLSTIRGNRVRRLANTSGGNAFAVSGGSATRFVVTDNAYASASAASGTVFGIYVGARSVCRGNVIFDAATPFSGCSQP